MDQPLRIGMKAGEPPSGSGGATAAAEAADSARDGVVGGRLFRKYILLLMGLVSATLLTNAGVDLYFTFRENESLLTRLELEKVDNAAQRIEQFFGDIERHVGWTTHVFEAGGAPDQLRLEYFRLLRAMPAVMEISKLDATGREELKISRVAMDVVGSRADFSHDPRFTEAVAHGVWYSSVHFRNGSEPYVTMAIARAGRDAGVTVVEVNLQVIWHVISSARIGQGGYAYAVDRQGRLIVHPDVSLVLRNMDFTRLPYVAASLGKAANGGSAPAAVTVQSNIDGIRVLSAHTALPALGWLVFVELPMTEALAPIYTSALHTGLVLLAGLVLATLAAVFLVRRMVGPIRLLQAGAARIGAGDLDSQIEVRTGDELEVLGQQFNTMARQLRQSYAGLERTVEERTRDLARSVTELQALSDVVRAVNSTLDLREVLTKIAAHAIGLASADGGAIFRYDASEKTFALAEAAGLDAALVDRLRALRIGSHESAMGEAALTRQPIQLAELALGPGNPLRDAILAAGLHSALVVPLVGPEQILGALVLVRYGTGEFAPSVVELMSTFASQSALAMQNASLFQQLVERGQQLQQASVHKSQFLANMSHELRTPLNAILGYTELLVDGIYGALPERPSGVLVRVQENGRNLLALINDVLDLAKIEAGQLTISPEEYRMPLLLQNVIGAMEPLARAKGLALSGVAADGMPAGYGDPRRLQQVLVNLVGNAIKFTDAGEVEVCAAAADGRFRVAVRDTGPGIAPEDQEKVFEEFQQVDNSSTRRKGGSGLGLAISRRIVALHGGRLSVVSAPGRGATFHIDMPVRIEPVARDAE